MDNKEIIPPVPIYQEGPIKIYKNHEDLETARLMSDMKLTDMEKFEQFMNLMRLGYKLQNAPKVHKTIKP